MSRIHNTEQINVVIVPTKSLFDEPNCLRDYTQRLNRDTDTDSVSVRLLAEDGSSTHTSPSARVDAELYACPLSVDCPARFRIEVIYFFPFCMECFLVYL